MTSSAYWREKAAQNAVKLVWRPDSDFKDNPEEGGRGYVLVNSKEKRKFPTVYANLMRYEGEALFILECMNGHVEEAIISIKYGKTKGKEVMEPVVRRIHGF